MATEIQVLKVLKLLDRQTVLIGGGDLSRFQEGTEVDVLAVGSPLQEVEGVPLVIPKARLEVTSNAGAYLVASPVVTTSDETDVFSTVYRTRKVRRREPLNVAETDLAGNPAGRPIVVGDPVIEAGKLQDFVNGMKEHLQGR